MPLATFNVPGNTVIAQYNVIKWQHRTMQDNTMWQARYLVLHFHADDKQCLHAHLFRPIKAAVCYRATPTCKTLQSKCLFRPPGCDGAAAALRLIPHRPCSGPTRQKGPGAGMQHLRSVYAHNCCNLPLSCNIPESLQRSNDAAKGFMCPFAAYDKLSQVVLQLS